ncbi:MAG: hypothetical protein COA79_21925 [Planctomycetota bacterium]|nr:MAG: hypothetical protein COA79_21925 [Planctomycetota bacterium]
MKKITAIDKTGKHIELDNIEKIVFELDGKNEITLMLNKNRENEIHLVTGYFGIINNEKATLKVHPGATNSISVEVVD